MPTTDYRHPAKTKNLPPAGLAAQGKIEQPRKVQYAYNPHLPPVLRFDASGASDRLPELLEIAKTRPLTDDGAHLLGEALVFGSSTHAKSLAKPPQHSDGYVCN